MKSPATFALFQKIQCNQRQQIASGGLVGDPVRAPVALHGIAVSRVFQCVAQQGHVPVVQAVIKQWRVP